MFHFNDLKKNYPLGLKDQKCTFYGFPWPQDTHSLYRQFKQTFSFHQQLPEHLKEPQNRKQGSFKICDKLSYILLQK
jgi:hypothetical protein